MPKVDNQGRLHYGDYPNAFERLLGVLESGRSGQLWATARPGSEFRFGGSQVHVGGGSHASLHALDSVIPLIVAGAPPDLPLPPHLRTVDITPLCLSILGLTPPVPVGASRATKERIRA